MTPSPTTALQAARLEVRYGRAPAVRAVDLALTAGAWTGVIGANGSGKTSLLRCLAGRMAPSAGTIEVEGRRCEADPAWRAARVGMGELLDQLPGGLTAAELIGLMEQAHGGPADDPVAALVDTALALPGLVGRPIGAMSSGQKQRVAIRLAFCGARRVVLLDEPFNWLDPAVAHDLKTALRTAVRDHGLALLTALHDVATLANWCDRGVLMKDGRAVAVLEAEDLAAARGDLAGFEAEIVRRVRGSR